MAWNVLFQLSNAVKGGYMGYMVSPAATELALINIFIIVLIILEGVIRIGSAKSGNIEPY